MHILTLVILEVFCGLATGKTIVLQPVAILVLSLGGLEQLSGSAAVCEDDEADFVCSSSHGGIINWRITLPTNIKIPEFGFGIFFTSPRTFNGPRSSVIAANVSFVNETFIVSTVTFHGAIYLNNTLLECDGNTITYYVIETS